MKINWSSEINMQLFKNEIDNFEIIKNNEK